MKRIKLIIFALVLMLIPGIVFAHTVTFDTDGGSDIPQQTVDNFGNVNDPGIPTKGELYFMYWYDDDEGHPWDFRNFVTSDMTLHAKWIDKSNVISKMDISVKMLEAGTKIEVKEIYNGDTLIGLDVPSLETTINPAYDQYDTYIVKNRDRVFFEGTLEAGKTYLVFINGWFTTDDHPVVDRNVIITVNGKEIHDFEITSTYSLYAFAELPVMATFDVEGGGQTFIHGDTNTLTFKCEGALDKLTKVLVNGKEIKESDRELSEGSTVLTLTNEYLNSLDAGEYTLTFVYSDGEGSTTFKVVNNPKTGDFIHIYVLTLIMSSIGLLVIRKRLN